MPLASQIRLMEVADVIISLPGTDMLNALFQPKVSAAIIPFRFFLNSFRGSNEADRLLMHLEGRLIRQVPYGPVGRIGVGGVANGVGDFGEEVAFARDSCRVAELQKYG